MRRLNRGRGNEKEKGSGVVDSFDVAREDGAIEERLERGGILEDEESDEDRKVCNTYRFNLANTTLREIFFKVTPPKKIQSNALVSFFYPLYLIL